MLQPLEKLRMPNFDFTNDEIQRLLTAIMSFQREIQPASAMPARSARVDNLGVGHNFGLVIEGFVDTEFNDVALPEPASVLLSGVGLMLVAVRLRRRAART